MSDIEVVEKKGKKRLTRADKEAMGLPIVKKEKFTDKGAIANEAAKIRLDDLGTNVGAIVVPDRNFDAFAGIEDLILGDTKADFEKIFSLRDEAYDYMRRSSAIKLSELKRKADDEAANLQDKVIKEIETMVYNSFKPNKDAPFTEKSKKYAQQQQWVALEHHGNDPEKKARYDAVIDQMFKVYPDRKLAHDANQEKAFAVLAAYEKAVADQQAYYEKAQALFAEANTIARRLGVPETNKENKNDK